MALQHYAKSYWIRQMGYRFDIKQASIDPSRTLSEQFHEAYDVLQQMYYNDEEIYGLIVRAHQLGRFVLEHAPKLDYDANIQANGYWTNVLLSTKIAKLLVTTDQIVFKREHLIHIFKVINVASDICMKICLKQNIDGQSGPPTDKSVVNGVDIFGPDHLFASQMSVYDLLKLNQSLKPELNTLYAYYNSCWLGDSMSRVMQFVTLFVSVYSTQYKSIKYYNFFRRFNRGVMFTNMAQNIDLDCLKSMWNLTENRFVRAIFMYLIPSNITTKVIEVRRQHRWQIGKMEAKIHDLKGFRVQTGKPVRCLILQNNQTNRPNNKSLLLHIHGGGFICHSPDTHTSYLKHWAEKLDGIPILSVDYSLSPEHPYPTALQEVLDVYLWLRSKHRSVEKLLGFYPEKIAICGDSAGGNMTISVTLLIKHIREILKQKNEPLDLCPYPSGLYCFYSPFMLMAMVSPSRLISAIDGLIPTGILLCCLGAFVPKEVMFSVDYDDQPTSQSLVTSKDWSLLGMAVNTVDYYVKFGIKILNYAKKSLTIQRGVPWYRRETVKQTLTNLNSFCKNPFISPLIYNDFDIDIPLFLYPLVYDSFLDDSIEMAKLWKGEVHMEVFDELPHGFLNMVRFNERAMETALRCIPHMKKILD